MVTQATLRQAANAIHAMFDADGWMFRTEEKVSEITADIANKTPDLATGGFCKTSTNEVFRTVAGQGCNEKFSGIGKFYGVTFTPAQLVQMRDEHEDRKGQLYYAKKLPMMPGVRKTLRALAHDGFVMSAVSSNPSARTALGIDKMKLSAHFNARIYGPDNVGGLKKPDPASLLLAMEKSGIPAKRTVMSGDTLPDIISGTRAGVQVVGFVDPLFGADNGPVAKAKIEEFKDNGAHYVVRDFRQMRPILRAMALKIA
jgi:HAD superfamily hydrolase (TIGR01509 family)